MAMYSVACSAASLGFIQATLEPHLRDFNLSPLVIGSMFVVSGGCYGFSAPIWGMICDRFAPKKVTFVGKVLQYFKTFFKNLESVAGLCNLSY